MVTINDKIKEYPEVFCVNEFLRKELSLNVGVKEVSTLSHCVKQRLSFSFSSGNPYFNQTNSIFLQNSHEMPFINDEKDFPVTMSS